MASEFKIEVPIEAKGGGNSGGPSFGKLAAAVGVGNLASRGLSKVMEGLMKTLEPLINVLKALFIVVFLPLMPLITELTKIIADLIPGIQKLFGGDIDFAQFIEQFLAPALGDLVIAFVGAVESLIQAIWDAGESVGNKIADLQLTANRTLLEGLQKDFGAFTAWFSEKMAILTIDFGKMSEWFGNLGPNLWKSLNPSVLWLGDKLKGIWNIIKSPFEFLARKINDFFSKLTLGNMFGSGKSKSVEDAIISPNGQIITTAPDDYLIATKDPQSLGGGSGTININVSGNSFNNEQDMRKMVDMISRELSKKANRSFSR